MKSGTVHLIILLILGFTSGVSAQVFLTRDEALKQYFPNSKIERKTLFLTDAQVEQIQSSAKAKVESKILTYYVGTSAEGIKGYAFLETHIVRTMPETFMVVVNPDSTVRAVEILAFFEPEDYRPPQRWLETFSGKSLRDDLWLKRGVQNIVGATITARSLSDGVRRILAVYQTAVPKEGS